MALNVIRKTAIASLCLLFVATASAKLTNEQAEDVLLKLRALKDRAAQLEKELNTISAECAKRTMEYLAVCTHSTVAPCKEQTRISMLGPIAQKAMEIQAEMDKIAQTEKELVAQLDEGRAHMHLAKRYKERERVLEGLGLEFNTSEAYRQELLKKRNDSLEKSNAALQALALENREEARKAQEELAATRNAARKASSGTWPSWLGGDNGESKKDSE